MASCYPVSAKMHFTLAFLEMNYKMGLSIIYGSFLQGKLNQIEYYTYLELTFATFIFYSVEYRLRVYNLTVEYLLLKLAKLSFF